MTVAPGKCRTVQPEGKEKVRCENGPGPRNALEIKSQKLNLYYRLDRVFAFLRARLDRQAPEKCLLLAETGAYCACLTDSL
jgi:hypothetical protein